MWKQKYLCEIAILETILLYATNETLVRLKILYYKVCVHKTYILNIYV